MSLRFPVPVKCVGEPMMAANLQIPSLVFGLSVLGYSKHGDANMMGSVEEDPLPL